MTKSVAKVESEQTVEVTKSEDKVNDKAAAVAKVNELLKEKDNIASDDATSQDEEISQEKSEQGSEEEDSSGSEEASKAVDDAQIEEQEIPDKLVQAGRRAKMSDEEIIHLATYQPESLEALAAAQDKISAAMGKIGQSKKKSEDKIADDEKEGDDDFKLDIDPADYDEAFVEKVIKPFQKKINQLEKQMKTVNSLSESQQQSQAEATRRQIDNYFDEINTDYPSVGNSKNLSESEQKFRTRVVFKAESIAKGWDADVEGEPFTWDAAFKQSLNAITGNNTGALIKKINKTRTLMTLKPNSSRKPIGGEAKTDKERATEALKKMAEQRGLDELK